MSVSYRNRQSASVLLTREQLQALRAALADYVEETAPDQQSNETWDRTERRSEASKF
jgi:hypothetical protein